MQLLAAMVPVAALLVVPAASARAQATTPALAVNTPGDIRFAPTVAGGDPPAQAFVVRATSGGAPVAVDGLAVQAIAWEAFSGAVKQGWLTVTFDTTTTPAVVRLRASMAGVPAGSSQRATVDIGAPGATPARILVWLDAPNTQPALSLLSNGTTFTQFASLDVPAGADPRTAVAHGAALVVDDLDRVAVEGLALSSIHYDIGTPGWLTVSLDTTVTPAVLRIVARRRIVDSTATTMPVDLAPGNYRASYLVSGQGTRSTPQSMLVSFTVSGETTPPTGTPSLTIAGANQTGGANPVTRFVAIAGQRDPVPQALVVRNTSSGSYISGVAAGAVTYGAGQPTGWLALEQVGTTQNALLLLHARTAGLAPGSYGATFPVTTANAGSSTVTVNFVVQDPTPVLALNASVADPTVAVRAPRHGLPPATQVLPVLNLAPAESDRELRGLTLGAPTYSAGASGWLDAFLVDTAARTTLVMRTATTALPVGSYTATFPVLAPNASGSPRTVTVSYVVEAPTGPALAVSKDTVTLASTFDLRTRSTSITVSNAGGGSIPTLALDPIAYAAGEPTGWLAATLERTSAPSNLTFTATMSALPGGTYTAVVNVRAPEGTWDSPRPVVVRFTVPPRPSLAVATHALAFDAVAAGGDAPAQVVAITNAGGATLDRLTTDTIAYGAGQPTGWLTATLSGTQAPATLTLATHTGNLVPGRYTASIAVRSAATGILDSVQVVDVALVVAEQPGIVALSADSVLLSGATTTTALRATTVNVTNAATSGTLGGLAATIAYEDGGDWLVATFGAPTAPSVLTLAASPAGLAPGVHVATVTVSGTGATPATLTVRLEVVDIAAAGRALVSAPALPDAERARLDRLGNDDGTYNLGDYLAARTRTGIDP